MTQAVIDANTTDNQSVEDVNAQDDLDSLLSEYDTEVKKVEPTEPDIKEAVSWINEQRIKSEKEAEETAINNAVDTIKAGLEDLDFTPTNGMIRGMLQDNASKDPAIAKAFIHRFENPKAWDSALKRALKNIKQDLSIDTKATSDREAIASAVRSASTKQPTPEAPPDLNRMSDAEFQRYKMGLRG